MKRLVGDARGGTAIEFALVAPTFLMMLFLLLDGGRMLYTKQTLNSLAAAAARCMALRATGCGDPVAAKTWVVARARQRSQMVLSTSLVDISTGTLCNGQSNMAKARIDYAYKKGPLNLLPQSAVPDTLSATSCFPVPAVI